MAKVVFTPNIQRHVPCPRSGSLPAAPCGEVLEKVFAENPQARGYVLDDQSALRKHMTIFVDGAMIRDRARLTDAVSETSTVYVFQALVRRMMMSDTLLVSTRKGLFTVARKAEQLGDRRRSISWATTSPSR